MLRAERGRLAVEDDGPVGVAWGHRATSFVGGFRRAAAWRYGSFGTCGSSRLSFSMSVVRFGLSSLAA
jgi:hypothetical protein